MREKEEMDEWEMKKRVIDKLRHINKENMMRDNWMYDDRQLTNEKIDFKASDNSNNIIKKKIYY